MNLYEKCPACGGLGFLRGDYEKIGRWSYEVARRLGKPDPELPAPPADKCPVCEGDGVIISEEGAALLNFFKRHIKDILPESVVKFHRLDESPK